MSIPKLSDLEELANASTRERRRAEHMGWTFGRIRLEDTDFGISMTGSFKCVCGAVELFRFMIQPIELTARITRELVLDPARRLASVGSFSRLHLLEDGYSAIDVDRLMALGAEFDRTNP